MRYFIIALLFLSAVLGIHTFLVDRAPDRSVESGLQRTGPVEDQARQAQEDDKSIWDIQRQRRNNVPRN